MNLNRNLDEFVVDANILTSQKVQIEPQYRNPNSRLIKETNMTIMHNNLVISIQIMSLGGVYVYISDQNQLKKHLFEIKGSLLCQNGCQIFQIQNALILLLIFQDGQVIMRDLKEGNQEMLNISENFLIVSKCNFVKNEINFSVMVDENKIILIKYNQKELKLQNYQISSWLEYLSEKYLFDYFIEIIQGTHFGIMKDQVVIMQLVDKNINFSSAKLQITQQQNKIYEVEFFPFSPYKSNKKALFASIAIKTYTSVELYELRLFTNIKESLQFKQVQNFTFKNFQLELKNSFRLPGTILYTKEQIFMNNQYLFLTQNSTIKYVNLYGNGQFNQVLSLDANKYLISIIVNDVPMVLYDQYTSLLCQSPHSLQQQYCAYKQQAWYYNKKIKDKFEQTDDMSMIIQNLKFDFDEYDLENFFLLLHTIFRQPLAIYDKLDHYDQPELIQLLSDIFEEVHDDFIYVKYVFKRFDKHLIEDKLYDILGQIEIFIQSQDKYQIQLKESFPIKNERILRLILATSSHLLQDLHNYYFYCIIGLYLLNFENEEYLENIQQYEPSYFLLLSSVKLILSKQIKNYLLSKQLPEISQQTETFNQVEIMSGVSSIIRYIFDVEEISKLLAYSTEFNQSSCKILKIYPINEQLLLEYQILNLIKKYKIGNRLGQELLTKLSRYEAFYGIEEIKMLIRLAMKKFFNQNIVNYILMRHLYDEDLLLKLIDYAERFDSADSLRVVINHINEKQFSKIIPIFYRSKTLRLLCNTKINNSLLTYIHKYIIQGLNECNLNNQQQIKNSSNLVLHQAQFLSTQGLKKQAIKLIMLHYDQLDLQDKNINLIYQQIDQLMNILIVFQQMSRQNRYFLVLKDTNNIIFFKTRQQSKGKINLKKILPYRTQLQNIWSCINAEINQLQTLCPIIKRQPKNNLTYGEYQQLDILNRLPDNFRYIRPDQKKLKFQKAAYYQQQLLYNMNQTPTKELKKYNEITIIQNSNKLLKHTIQTNKRDITITKVEKVNNLYKVYNQQEILNIVELMCIQQYLILNGYQYTQITNTMATQLLDIIDIKQDESKDDIIIASVYFIELVKYIDTHRIQIKINKILDICMKHNIVRLLLDRILLQKPTKFVIKAFVKYLSQDSQDDLIIDYFSTSFTEWAIQELIYLENNYMAEVLALKLISKFIKARLSGSKVYCFEPDTVEALLAIQGSDKFRMVMKRLVHWSWKKAIFCWKIKVLQKNGITYEQYQKIRINKQVIQQKRILTPLVEQLKTATKRHKLLTRSHVVDSRKQLKKKAEISLTNMRQISRITQTQQSLRLKDQQNSNQAISQIYDLLQQKIKFDGQGIIQTQENELSSTKIFNCSPNRVSLSSQSDERQLIFTFNQQNSDPIIPNQRQNKSILTNKQILIIDQVKVLEKPLENRLEITERQSKSVELINKEQGIDQKINKIYLKSQEQQLNEKRLDDQDHRETDYPILIKNQPIKYKDKFEASRSTIDQSRINTSEHSFRDSSISVQQDGLNQINKFFFQSNSKQQEQ